MQTNLSTLAQYNPVEVEAAIDQMLGLTKHKPSELQRWEIIQTCLANELDPRKKEVHVIPFWDKDTGSYGLQCVTSYTVYLKRANQSGQLNGWETEIYKDDNGNVTGGKITIHRKDRDNPFEREASFDEVVSKRYDKTTKKWIPTHIRQTKPEFMTKKVLIGQ